MSKMYDSFIDIIEQQPELFSDEDRLDLIEQSVTWSEEPKQLNDSVGKWLRARPNIRTAAMKNLSGKENDRSDRNIRLSGNGTKAPVIKPEDYKPMLLNAIHRSFNPETQAVTATNNSN